MRHPDRLASSKPAQELGGRLDVRFRAPELSLLRVANDAAEGDRHCLKPVTDTEYRYPGEKKGWVRYRGPLGIDALRTAREYDRTWTASDDLGDRGGMG